MPSVKGIVVGPGDQPIPEAAVIVLGSQGADPDVGALTDADGAFRLTLASPGTYRVGVYVDGGGTAEVEVSVPPEGADALHIRLA